MGRQSSDQRTVVGSSIALLQERFRRLERARERREEQDLLKLLFSESQPMIIFPVLPPSGHELSLRPNTPGKISEFRDVEAGTLANSQATKVIIRSSSPNVENCEVDTTLHL